jgi:O-antigen/teichoic acid export membrane protein
MLGPENRGYLALLILFPFVLARLGGMGLPAAIPYYLTRPQAPVRAIARLLIAPAAFQTTLLLIAHGIVLYAFLQHKPPVVQIAGLFTLVSIPSSLCLEYSLSVLQGQQRYGPFNALRSLLPLAYAILVLGIFLTNERNLIDVTLVSAIAGLVASLGALGVMLSGLPLDRPGLVPERRDMIGFGLRGLLSYVSPVETFRLDQAVVGLLLSPAALGLYVVGLAFTTLPRLISQSVGLIAYPYIASRQSEGSPWRSISRFLWFGLAVTIPAIAIIAATASVSVPFFFGREFAGAVPVTRVLLIGGVFLAARRILTDGARGAGYPGIGTVAEIASWLGLIVGIVVLEPRWGVLGVGMAFVLAAVVGCAVLLVALRIVSARQAADQPIQTPPIREPQRA